MSDYKLEPVSWRVENPTHSFYLHSEKEACEVMEANQPHEEVKTLVAVSDLKERIKNRIADAEESKENAARNENAELETWNAGRKQELVDVLEKLDELEKSSGDND